MKNIFLAPPFDKAWEGKDPFEEIRKIKGTTYREVKTRHTLNFQFNGESFYIKIHQGTTLKEILKNLFSLKLPILGARNEFEAINRLHELGVDTMEVVAFGERGLNPLTRESFIITKDLNPTISLEDYCKAWKANPPPYAVKKALIEKVAEMVRKMHEGGVNHRDCYICHFLLQQPWYSDSLPHLYIIDLHRAQIRNCVPERWRNKDLTALFYSSMQIGLSKKDYLKFISVYSGNLSTRQFLSHNSKFLNSIREKAKRIQKRTLEKKL